VVRTDKAAPMIYQYAGAATGRWRTHNNVADSHQHVLSPVEQVVWGALVSYQSARATARRACIEGHGDPPASPVNRDHRPSPNAARAARR
jgi:hypothetical protein